MSARSRRPRRRASDIAGLPKRGNMWFMVLLVMGGLIVVMGLKWTMGDTTSTAFQTIAGDPDLDLPGGPTDSDGGIEQHEMSSSHRVNDGGYSERPDAGEDQGVR